MKRFGKFLVVGLLVFVCAIALVACIPAEEEQEETPMTEAEIIEKMKSDVTNSVSAFENDILAKPEAEAAKLALALPNEDELDGYLEGASKNDTLFITIAWSVEDLFYPVTKAVEQLAVGDLAYRHRITYDLENNDKDFFHGGGIIEFVGIHNDRTIVAMEWFITEGETITRDSADKMYFSFYWNSAEDYEVEIVTDIGYKKNDLTLKDWVVGSYNRANNSTYAIQVQYIEHSKTDSSYVYNYVKGDYVYDEHVRTNPEDFKPTAFTELVDRTVEEVMANYRKPVGENGEVLYDLDEPKPLSEKTIKVTVDPIYE